MPVARLLAISPVFALAVLFGMNATGARAQDDTVMIGSPGGGGVTVDLSVLNDFGRPQDGSDGLRFPGSPVGPEDAVRLHPPGAKPALKRPTRKKPRRAKKKKPATPKPKAPAVAKAAPPPPTPSLSRSDVPPPPPPAAMKPDLPPVTPAPRTAVDQSKIAPPPEQTAALPKPPAADTAFKVGTTRAIAFGAGSASLPDDAAATLKAAADLLKADNSLRVQIKAYATGEKDNESKARRLSLSRALGVRSVLIKEGVQPTRIDVRALGSQVPDGAADRVDLSVVAR
jgi:outer membrane protein OmpA-like peptidoglycan-associated protein